MAKSRPSNQIAERPDDTGYPQGGTRRGGGSRGGVCDTARDMPPLTALMPDTATWIDTPVVVGGSGGSGQTAEEIVFSFTASPSPDLWFYLPYRLVDSSRVEFTLKDGAGDTISRTRLDTTETLPTVPSIVRVSLSALGLTLTPETDYHWYLTVHCQGGPPIAVDGWIRYPSLSVDPLTQPTNAFWVDRLSVLADAQLLNPDDESAQVDWRELLESVGLGDIAGHRPIPIDDPPKMHWWAGSG
ncbi:MAG: DUF928 domain-containing protein, partial [Cyanobacteria bacterium J06633_23]